MKFLVKEIRTKEGVLQFRRWRLFSCPWFGIFIHKIYISDNDIHPHNHPWNFLSIVLDGLYEETSKNNKLLPLRKFGSIYTLNTREYHRMYISEPSTVLIITGKRKTDSWGYWTENGFVDWETYRESHDTKIEEGKT